jgi:hypothetical protein
LLSFLLLLLLIVCVLLFQDFAVPDLQDGQPSRFATILLYLNDVPKGGETSFPRWLNGETTEILKVTPEPGKAILFYNQLPDGNYDERSEHAALPVIEGEKWLANLWVWVSSSKLSAGSSCGVHAWRPKQTASRLRNIF